VRGAVEGRQARVIYPWLYTVVRWFPNVTRMMLDVSTPPPYSLNAPERKKALKG
jgi:hypothetical protein